MELTRNQETHSEDYIWLDVTAASAALGVSKRYLQYRTKEGDFERKREGNKSYYKIPRELVSESFDIDLEDIEVEVDGPTLKPVTLNNTSTLIAQTEVKDVTEEVIAAGGVAKFLELLKSPNLKVPVVHKPKVGKHTKILSLSDIHCPFQNQELIDRVLVEHADADVVVLNGDIIDGYAASSFTQDKLVTILEEYNSAFDLVLNISTRFPKVVLVRGNHDQRVDRYFSKKMEPHMFALAQKDILWRLANGYIYDDTGEVIGKHKFTNVIYNPQKNLPWVAQVGKTLFMHPSSYAGKQMQTVMNAMVHIENLIDRDSYDSIIIGHTHKVGKLIERGKLLIEQGCMTSVMDYQKEGRLISRPQVLGYAVIYQDEKGNTDFNKSNFVYEGTLNYIA